MVLLAASVLAGCSTPKSDADCSPGTTPCATDGCPTPPCGAERPGDMVVSGLVQSDALVPLGGANVTIPELGLKLATDGNGRFTFPGVQPSIYTVAAEHAGFARTSMVARPEVTSLIFILPRAAPTQPYNVTLPPFHGFLECASEELIISGPCDIVVQEYGHTTVFQNQSAFQFRTDLAWKTIVVDLVFDKTNNPGIAGMREVLRLQNSTATLGTYEQYGRFHGAQSFSTRIEAGQTYEGGIAPVPHNVTDFRVDFYAEGNGYHKVCYPIDLPGHPADCLLGVGGAVDLRFDAYVTIFYVDPAPAGFTLLGK